MEKQITIQVSESELDDIIHCLYMRANSKDVASEWRAHYRKLADKLQEKTGGINN